jgi:hypothetical protein
MQSDVGCGVDGEKGGGSAMDPGALNTTSECGLLEARIAHWQERTAW